MGLSQWIIDQAVIPFEPEEEEIALRWLQFTGYVGMPAFALGSSLPFVLLSSKLQRSRLAMAGLCGLVGSSAFFLTVFYASSRFGEEILESDTPMGQHAREAYQETAYYRYLQSGGDPDRFKPPQLQVKKKSRVDQV